MAQPAPTLLVTSHMGRGQALPVLIAPHFPFSASFRSDSDLYLSLGYRRPFELLRLAKIFMTVSLCSVPYGCLLGVLSSQLNTNGYARTSFKVTENLPANAATSTSGESLLPEAIALAFW